MKLKIALIAAVAALATAALVSAGLAAASSGSRPSVGVEQSKLGRILVDSRGHTLYLFGKDASRKSTCYGACAGFWPPLIVTGKPTAGPGVHASLLGTIVRKDGRHQVTYKGHPLYLFAKDVKKGQTNGEGLEAFGAEWYAVGPSGAKVEKAAAPSGGYGYDTPPGGYGY